MSRGAPPSSVSQITSIRLQVTSNSKSQSQIDLSNRKLGAIPNDVFTFTHVQVLKLPNNEINHLPSSISHLRSLKVLHLEKNRITCVPETIVNCKNLTELNLSANCLEVLPASLCSLKKLRSLDLANNQIEQLPHDIGHLNELRHLVLNNNKLWYLPFSVTNLHKIWSLNIGDNLFDHIPMPVCQMTSLHTLNASHNRLTSLPPDFDHLKNLRELNLSDNKFTAVGTVVRLLQLKYINMNNNRLQLLPVDMSRLRQLKVLHAQGNRLQSVPDVFMNTQFLNISHNELTSITVGSMLKMVNFNLSHNHLEALPHGLALLRNLKFLRLNKNVIREVTPDIARMKKLETLDLSDNMLTNLPLVVYQMNLKSFNIHGNNIAPLVPGTLEPVHRADHPPTHIEQQSVIEKPTKADTMRVSRANYSDNFIIQPHDTPIQEISLTKSPDSKSFSFFKRKVGKFKEKQNFSKSLNSHSSQPQKTSTTKSKVRSQRPVAPWDLDDRMTSQRSRPPLSKTNATLDPNVTVPTRKRQTSRSKASWNLNGTLRSHASLETLPGLDERRSKSSHNPPMSRHRSESNLNMMPLESMNVLSTAEFQIEQVQADFSSEDEEYHDDNSMLSEQSFKKQSLKAITRRLVKADKPAYQSTNHIKATGEGKGQWFLRNGHGQPTTDFNLLGVCTELETMMNKKLLHPGLVLNTGLAKRFNEKVLKKTDDGLWRMSADDVQHVEDNRYGIEYSPIETFTITETGGHYISNYDINIQVMVPARSVLNTVHATIQALKINNKVLSQVQELNRFAENVLEIGPIVMLQLLEEVNFNSQVKVTIPAPKKVKGHLMLLTVQRDNSCVPSSSSYQFNHGIVTFNTWHFTRRVAIVTKAKCKYKACKSMEQILQCLGLVNDV